MYAGSGDVEKVMKLQTSVLKFALPEISAKFITPDAIFMEFLDSFPIRIKVAFRINCEIWTK